MSILERSFPRIARRSGGRLAGLLVAATLALAGVAAVAPSEASATTMVYADVKRLVAISDVVVHGVVESRRVFYGDHDRITTEWSIVVKDAWKGGFAERVLVRQWAGELDGESMRIPGDASFREGEEVVLFLKGDRPEQMYLSAMGQAKFSVHRRLFPDVPMPPASAGGALIISLPSHLSASSNGTALVQTHVYRDLRNIAFYDNGGEGPPVFTIDGVETLSFDTLREMVLEAAAAGEGAR